MFPRFNYIAAISANIFFTQNFTRSFKTDYIQRIRGAALEHTYLTFCFLHDDVMTWAQSPHYWSFVRKIRRYRGPVIQWFGFWVFSLIVEETVDQSMICDAMPPCEMLCDTLWHHQMETFSAFPGMLPVIIPIWINKICWQQFLSVSFTTQSALTYLFVAFVNMKRTRNMSP